MTEEITHTYRPDGKRSFVMKVAVEGQPTVDGREFTAGSIDWRQMPIPLMLQRANDPTGRGGHKGAVAVGSFSEMWRENDDQGFGTIYGRGYFSSDDIGQEAMKLIDEGVISGVSADVGGAVHEELEFDADGKEVTPKITYGSILSVTALPIPAFNDTKVSVAEAIVAASGPDGWAPPSDWFGNPSLEGPTPITVTADGRIYGHAALWGTCHVGFKDRCVSPPRSTSNYAYFNVGNVLTADGKTVNVGRLTAGTGHAALEFGAQPAKEHYDNTGWGAGYVHAGEDDFGIWFAGAVAPTASMDQIATLRASATSGDWRAIKNSLELVGILSVNTPGFPIPRAKVGLVAGAQVSLVASGLCGCENEEDAPVELTADPVIVETLSDPSDTLIAADLAYFDWQVAQMGRKKKGDCGCGCKGKKACK